MERPLPKILLQQTDGERRIRARASMLLLRGSALYLVQSKVGGELAWFLPGGAVEFGELTVDAARREVREELGIVVEGGQLYAVAESLNPAGSYHSLEFVYSAQWDGVGPMDLSERLEEGDDLDNEYARAGRWVERRALRGLAAYPAMVMAALADPTSRFPLGYVLDSWNHPKEWSQ